MIKYRSNPAEDEGMTRMDLRLLVKLSKAAHPDSNKVADSFHRHIPLFQKSEICRRLKTLVSKLFHERKVNKIVAFGLGSLIHPIRDLDNDMAVHRHYQHAALLAIRDAWTDIYKGGDKFDIYVQDPLYTKQDEEVLKNFGITVVDSNIGYQVGACLLDLYTLVVDFVARWPVSHVVFETARPAGILKSHPIDVDLEYDDPEREAIFHYELEPWTGYSESQSLVKGSSKLTSQRTHRFPGTGV
jgi:hypothetical protein